MKSIRLFIRTVFTHHTPKNARSYVNEDFWCAAQHYGVAF